jgi:Nucleotide-diphospho-sugar transferase
MSGYLYVATGDKYLQECLVSASSLRQRVPDAQITLVTDNDQFENPLFNQILRVEKPAGSGYLYKIAGLMASPYEQTFFIDTDTWFCDACTELFQLLQYYDLCLTHCPNDAFTVYNGDNQPVIGYHAYNTGVIVFRKNERTARLFEAWYAAYQKGMDKYPHDQPPLMEALLYHEVKLCVLQTIYNARTPYPSSYIGKPVKIIHGRHRNYPRMARKLNRHLHNRVWFPPLGLILYFKRSFLFRWYLGLDPKYKQVLRSFLGKS